MGDADITLRHITRRRPEDLARAFVHEDGTVEVLGWIDTQVTTMERRLDKALRLRVGGEPRVLHIEFCDELRADVSDRIFEYTCFLFTALRAEAPESPVPPIESIAVVLRGRRRLLPRRGERRTSWPGSPFSGVRYRIDAVYQRTVAELRARGSVLWLSFTPLARDATPATMREIIEEIRVRALNEEERAELYATLVVLASVDPWGHNLEREIIMSVEEKTYERLKQTPIIGAWFVEAEQKGIEKGVAHLLQQLFMRRFGRELTANEERSLAERVQTLGEDRVGAAVLDLDGDALARRAAAREVAARFTLPARSAETHPTRGSRRPLPRDGPRSSPWLCRGPPPGCHDICGGARRASNRSSATPPTPPPGSRHNGSSR
ncbi:Hypothetical protein A7982_11134 [Minicystis rosea]|nr:Hypothetical protein A7982_11134 [Minicystis rosea]